MKDIVTSDLSEFGYREFKLMSELLNSYIEYGLPRGFDNQGLTIMFNRNSGYVFFTNEDYQICMLNGDKLEIWHNCANCGREGFREDFENFDISDETCCRT